MDLVEVGRRQLGATVRRLVAGVDEPTHDITDPDRAPGWFDAGSATWRVHADAAMLVGGVRALLIQTLHPQVMAGVADHSAYRTDPLGRLHRTAQFLGATTYGTAADAEQVMARVRAIHDQVQGTTPAGVPYRANDPHLLGWVHCTEVDSFWRSHRRYSANPMPASAGDGYVAEMAVVGRALGYDTAPTDLLGLSRQLADYRRELHTSAQSRAALWFLANPGLPLPARAPYGVLFAGAVGLLPGWARRMMWLPRFPLTETVAVRGATTLLLRTLGWALAPPTVP